MKRLSKKQEEENKERTLEKVKHFFTDFGAYIFTIVGIIMGPSVADMLHGKVPKPPQLARTFSMGVLRYTLDSF